MVIENIVGRQRLHFFPFQYVQNSFRTYVCFQNYERLPFLKVDA